MNVFYKAVTAMTLISAFAFPTISHAQVAEVVVEICSETGCYVPEPEIGLAIAILTELTKELNKPDRFGESNEIIRAINELNKFINHGMGENNDIRKFIEDAGIDRLLKNLGIKLF